MKFTVGSKLLVSFGAVVATIVAMAVINWVSVSSGIRAVELARDEGYAGVSLAGAIKMDVAQVWQWLTDISATRGAEGFDDGFDEAAHYADQFHEHISALMALHPDDAERLGALGDSFDAFYAKGQWMAQQYIDGGSELGNVAMEEFDTYAVDMSAQLDALVTEMDAEAAASMQAVIDKNSQSRLLGVAFALLAAVAAAVIAFFLTRAIARPANQAATIARSIAKGEIDHSIKGGSQDELGQMLTAFGQMIEYLQGMAVITRRIADGDLTVHVEPQSDKDALGNAFVQMITKLQMLIGSVRQGVEDVSLASAQLDSAADQSGVSTQQIAQTIGQVATGTVQQAERIQRTRHIVAEQSQAIRDIASGALRQARAVEDAQHMLSQQLEIAIRQVDESATQSAHSAQQAQSVAKTGGDTVRKTVHGMQAIAKATEQVSQRIAEMGQRSGEIGMIVQTIDEIAERTNLLALNAAIEAARAGEHGRGFAVVADEVRKLAEQSASSAKEITQLIKAVQDTAQQARTAMEQGGRDVVQGVSLATEAEEGLNQIQDVVGDVSTQMASLSKAVAQMGSSRDALLGTMEQVAAIVEENTASTEQLTVTSEQVLLEMEDVAAISEQNSAAAEEVSAGAEEVSAQVEQTVASANSLANMAQTLRKVVQEFRLTKTDDDLASQMATFKQAHDALLVSGATRKEQSPPTKIAVISVPRPARPKRFAWDESMRTGDEKVDDQHRELIRQINELLEMMAQGKGRNHLDSVLDNLEAYTQTHFRWEEGCMAEHHCPMAQTNKEAHAKFIRMVFETRQRLEREGTSAELVLSVQKNLGDWLVNHICHVDTSLRSCMEGGKQSSREPQVFRSRKERDPVQGFEKIVVPATNGHHAH